MANGGPNQNPNDKNIWFKIGYTPVYLSAVLLKVLLSAGMLLVYMTVTGSYKGLRICKDILQGGFQALKDNANLEMNAVTLPIFQRNAPNENDAVLPAAQEPEPVAPVVPLLLAGRMPAPSGNAKMPARPPTRRSPRRKKNEIN